MSLAINKFLARRVDDAAIDTFLAGKTFPLVENESLTFVYRGAADAVYLRHFIYGLPSGTAFKRHPGTDFWYLTIELPEGSRVEYKLDIHRNGGNEWVRDPLNPNLAHDPFGANSVAQGKGYERPEWTHPDPEARRGGIEEFVLRDTPFGDPRRISVYVPARFRPQRRYPMLIVHDGGDYVNFAAFKTVLDNLIHRLEVAPLIAVLLHPTDRLIEYADDARHARFVAEQVVPFIEERYTIYPGKQARCLMGASFGAVASLSTAYRYPDTFGSLLLQSGSFAFTDIGEQKRGPAFDRVVEFVNEFRENPGKPVDKVFVSCGVYESLIYENRSMVPRLQSAGMTVRYVEARDGHNWENWRDRMRSALSWLFPGPLWMVYE